MLFAKAAVAKKHKFLKSRSSCPPAGVNEGKNSCVSCRQSFHVCVDAERETQHTDPAAAPPPRKCQIPETPPAAVLTWGEEWRCKKKSQSAPVFSLTGFSYLKRGREGNEEEEDTSQSIRFPEKSYEAPKADPGNSKTLIFFLALFWCNNPPLFPFPPCRLGVISPSLSPPFFSARRNASLMIVFPPCLSLPPFFD